MSTKPKLSRRQLLARAEQGRAAMRMLAAAIIEYGGGLKTLRVPVETYREMDPTTRVEVELSELTATYILKVSDAQDTKTPEVPAASDR